MRVRSKNKRKKNEKGEERTKAVRTCRAKIKTPPKHVISKHKWTFTEVDVKETVQCFLNMTYNSLQYE